MKQPNVIFIMADQLRYDMLGRGLTPNIDSIASDGVTFDNAYCACPLCAPSRGAIFTGTYPNTNGSRINPWILQDAEHGEVRSSFETLYELMERSGYDCIHSGKQHLFTQGDKLEYRADTRTRWLCTEKTYREDLLSQGVRMPGGKKFRSFVPEMISGKHTRASLYSNPTTGCYEPGVPYYFDEYFAQRAVNGLKERDTSRPLFLSAMFLAPHPPLDVPEPYYNAVANGEVSLPENVGKWYENQSPLQLYNLPGAVGTQYSLAQWQESWRVYMGLVKMLDDCVGKIIHEIKQQGIYDDSIIVFTSDHGEMLGSHRLFQKMCMYEESIRTPLYFKLPKGMHKGKAVHAPTSQINIMPTLCDLLLLEPSHTQDGSSLMTLLEGDISTTPVFIQYDGNGSLSNFQRCVISNGYKLIADIFKDEVYFELYDMQKDVQETNNLLFAFDPINAIAIAQQLLDQLELHMKATNDLISLPNTNLKQFVAAYQGLSQGTL